MLKIVFVQAQGPLQSLRTSAKLFGHTLWCQLYQSHLPKPTAESFSQEPAVLCGWVTRDPLVCCTASLQVLTMSLPGALHPCTSYTHGLLPNWHHPLGSGLLPKLVPFQSTNHTVIRVSFLMFSVTPNTAFKNPIMLLASIQSSEWTSLLEQVLCKSHPRWAQEDDFESSLGYMRDCLKYTWKTNKQTSRENHLCSDPCLLLYWWPSFHHLILRLISLPSLHASCNPHLAEMMLDPISFRADLPLDWKLQLSICVNACLFTQLNLLIFFISASTLLPPKSPEW